MKLLSLFLVFLSISSYASRYEDFLAQKVHYKTYFGNCPSKVAGDLTIELMREYDKKRSLLSLKKKIIEEDLLDKYFLKSYDIKYNPNQKLITFKYDCPEALMSVQIYKEGGEDFYTAVLVDNGRLFDPAYEVLLRSTGKIKGELPNLAMPVSMINKSKHFQLTEVVQKMNDKVVDYIAEAILSEKGELTLILSVDNQPSSVFLGDTEWTKKLDKLTKVIGFMRKKKTIPSVINISNSKKVVVKFPQSI